MAKKKVTTVKKKKSIPAKARRAKPQKDDSKQELKAEKNLDFEQETKKLVKNIIGRPSNYKPEMCEKIIYLMAEGKSKEVAAIELGITKMTLYDWINPGDHENPNPRYKPEFAEALEVAESFCRRWWEEIGRYNLSNKEFNATLYMMNMQNRFAWSRRLDGKIQHEHTHEHKHNHELFAERTDEHAKEVLRHLVDNGALDETNEIIVDAEVH